MHVRKNNIAYDKHLQLHVYLHVAMVAIWVFLPSMHVYRRYLKLCLDAPLPYLVAMEKNHPPPLLTVVHY